MQRIYKNLYQYSVYLTPMDFTIHQYLLASEPAILFAAGTVQQPRIHCRKSKPFCRIGR